MGQRVGAARRAADRLAEIDARLSDIRSEHPLPDLADVPREALDRERVALDSEIADLRAQELEAFRALENAREKLAALGGDASVALLDAERSTQLVELRAESERYLRRTLGLRAVREAIRRFRDAHRSSMLEAASDAFRIVTRGAYAGLTAEAVGSSEALIAVGADGTSKPATELALSKGTRFQLYLALRVAAHREYAKQRAPLPFVLDDIMETFDDFRAEEAFRLLGHMAELGQVIYLTHHRHLLPIAETACPGVRILEVPE
jgi:uncharacterized protein YhaN